MDFTQFGGEIGDVLEQNPFESQYGYESVNVGEKRSRKKSSRKGSNKRKAIMNPESNEESEYGNEGAEEYDEGVEEYDEGMAREERDFSQSDRGPGLRFRKTNCHEFYRRRARTQSED